MLPHAFHQSTCILVVGITVTVQAILSENVLIRYPSNTRYMISKCFVITDNKLFIIYVNFMFSVVLFYYIYNICYIIIKIIICNYIYTNILRNISF